jgi:hypothetical protein
MLADRDIEATIMAQQGNYGATGKAYPAALLWVLGQIVVAFVAVEGTDI